MNKVWVYGVNSVDALLKEQPECIATIWHSRRLLQEQIAMMAAHKIDCVKKSNADIQRVCGDVVHQGIAALCVPPQYLSESQLLALLERIKTPLLLVLDRIVDPRNLGACLRTAEACGVDAVVLPSDQSATLTTGAMKTAAGSALRVPVARVNNLVRCLEQLKEHGIWVSGAHAQGKYLYREIDYRRPTAIVLGAEHEGLRRLTEKTCDYLVRLPMQGKVESLNVSAAAAALLYEIQRQRS